jgi:SAM-dependent methyltransferase
MSLQSRARFLAKHPLAAARYAITRDRSYLEQARLLDLSAEGVPEIDDLVEYLQISLPEAVKSLSRGEEMVASSYTQANPRTAEEMRDWHRNCPEYLFDLVIWNIDPKYRSLLAMLRDESGGVCLSFGGGIGTEALRLAGQGNEVWYCDVPDSPVWHFAQWRAERRDLPIRFTAEVPDDTTFDCVVAFNVFSSMNESELPAIVERLVGAMRPGGRLYCSLDFVTRDDHPNLHDHDRLWLDLVERLPLEEIDELRVPSSDPRQYVAVYEKQAALAG